MEEEEEDNEEEVVKEKDEDHKCTTSKQSGPQAKLEEGRAEEEGARSRGGPYLHERRGMPILRGGGDVTRPHIPHNERDLRVGG